jgi:C4-dicarboxylate transporter, DctQ subunit
VISPSSGENFLLSPGVIFTPDLYFPLGQANPFTETFVRLIKKIENILGRIEALSVTLLLSLMILFSFTQVLLRNFFNDAILWADIFTRQLVLWVGFLGASLAVRENKHISIDFLPNILPKSWGNFIQFTVNLTAGIVSGFLAFAAWRFVQFEMDGQATLFLDTPAWVFQVILPYSFGIISVRFLLKTVQVILSPEKPN